MSSFVSAQPREVDEDPVESSESYSPRNMRTETDSIGSVLKMLSAADDSSRKALHSMSYPDGKQALETIDSSIQGLESIPEALSKLLNELKSRRAQIARAVHPIHNKDLPVMRLPSDILHIIFEYVAVPLSNQGRLGWMTISHVCAAWRHVSLSLASLWAREVGAFRSLASFREILDRAREAPLTLKNTWAWFDFDPLPVHYWPLLSCVDRIRAIHLLNMHAHDVKRLSEVLASGPFTELRSLALHSREHAFRDSFPAMACHLNLRWLSFQNMIVPFEGHNLVGLLITASDLEDTGDTQPSVTLDRFLDMLETCEKLTTISLSRWMPSVDRGDSGLHRTVKLPSLRTLTLSHGPNHASYIDLCTHLILPLLTYIFIHEAHISGPEAIPTMIHWLFLSSPTAPCIRDASRLSVESTGGWSSHEANDFQMQVDDGRHHDSSMGPYLRFPIDHARNDLTQSGLTGVNCRFRYVTDGAAGSISDSDFFRLVTRSWRDCSRSSPRPRTIRNIYFRSSERTRAQHPDWSTILRELEDVEMLYIHEPPFIWGEPGEDRDDGLLAALAMASQDGAMLLPNLHTIVFALAYCLLPDATDAVRHENALALVRTMLRIRAERGVPVRSMKIGSPDRERYKDESVGRDVRMDTYLQNLVAEYLHRVHSASGLSLPQR